MQSITRNICETNVCNHIEPETILQPTKHNATLKPPRTRIGFATKLNKKALVQKLEQETTLKPLKKETSLHSISPINSFATNYINTFLQYTKNAL